MNDSDEDTIPLITLPPPGIEVLHLSGLDEHLAAHACTDPHCLRGQGRLLLAPPCGHREAIGMWQARGRLWLVCARCDARGIVAVRWGAQVLASDEEEHQTTPGGHWPYGMVHDHEVCVFVYYMECLTRWSAWEVAAYVSDVPA
jgi:hypothetical protein